jgi:hypothetical protein
MKRHISAAFRNWFRSLSSVCRSPVARPHRYQGRRPGARPQLEELESRTLLSVTAHFSGSQLIVDGDGSGNTIRVDTVGSGELRQQRISYLAGGYVEVGRYAGFSSLLINSGAGNDVVNIDGILYPTSPLTINGINGHDVVNLNSAAQSTTVRNPAGNTDLFITDPLGNFSTTATVGPTSLTLAHPPFADSTYVINYTNLSGLLINLGNAGNTVVVNNTPPDLPGLGVSTNIYTGTGADTVNVLASSGHSLNLHGNGPNTSVEVGNIGSLAGILSVGISISNRNGDTSVIIRDWNREAPQTTTIDTGTSSDGQYMQVSNPGLATIYSQRANTRDLVVFTSLGAVSVNVLATWGHGLALYVNGVNTTVNVGSNGNSLDNIQAPVLVDGGATLNVNDQGTITDKSYVINADAVKRFINVDQGTYDAVVTYGAIGTLTINGSGSNGINGNDVFFVVGTWAYTNTTLNGGAVGAGGVNEFVAYAANGLDSLLGPLTTHGRPGTNSYLVYNDYLAPTAHTYTLTTNTVSRSGAASVTFDNLNQVILYVPSVGGNTINVPSLAAGVLDNLSVADGDTVTIGSNQTVAAVLGQVAIGPYDNTSATVVIDDSGNLTPLASTITLSNSPPYGYLISGLIPDGIYLGAGLNTTLNTSLRTGAGDKTFNMQDAPQGVALTLNAGSGTNTLDYTGYAGNVLVDLPLGAATGFSGISNIYNVRGASGGPAGSYNILVGFGGNVLTGGNDRRNLLIAGASGSTLIGGNDDDILIGGTTNWDTDPQWQAAFTAIMNEWTQATPYATRWDHLVNGGGLNDPFLLDPTPGTGTVHSNGGGNTLIGHGGGASELNLYFGSEGDRAASDWDAATEQFFIIV